jgi:hypothetical protein
LTPEFSSHEPRRGVLPHRIKNLFSLPPKPTRDAGCHRAAGALYAATNVNLSKNAQTLGIILDLTALVS